MKTFLGLAYIGFLLALAVGWVLNIIDIVHTAGGPLTALFVARIVGTFFVPLGVVLGYVS
jgi:hypothetical protein